MYTIDRKSDVPLYVQIRDSLELAIRGGRLKPGDRLPSVSAMAKEIGVTQATVRRALQDLSAAGLTDSHVGRGTFIRDDAAEEDAVVSGDTGSERQGGGRPSAHRGGVEDPKISAAKRMRSGVSKALYDIMNLARRPGIIELTHGVPDPGILPEQFIEGVCRDVLKNGSKNLIQTTDPMGMYELREEIAGRYSKSGVGISPEHVLITNGVSQGVSLIAQAAREDSRTLLCETPCFLGIANAFSAMGNWVETVKRDEAGPGMDQLRRISGENSHLLYLCSYLHNPTGRNISTARTAEIAQWARKTGNTVVSDEIFRDLRFDASSQADFLSELGPEQTIVVSSLSKTVMTGLRLGWIITSKERVKELARLKKLMDHACPTFIQAMAHAIFTTGKYDELTAALRSTYKRRMTVMLKSLEKMMPEGVTWSTPEGGFSMMLELPPGYSSVALLLFAVEKGVSFLRGPLFDIDHRYVNAIRLSCAWSDENTIIEGIELLADAVTEFIRQPPGDSGLSGLGGYQ